MTAGGAALKVAALHASGQVDLKDAARVLDHLIYQGHAPLRAGRPFFLFRTRSSTGPSSPTGARRPPFRGFFAVTTIGMVTGGLACTMRGSLSLVPEVAQAHFILRAGHARWTRRLSGCIERS